MIDPSMTEVQPIKNLRVQATSIPYSAMMMEGLGNEVAGTAGWCFRETLQPTWTEDLPVFPTQFDAD